MERRTQESIVQKTTKLKTTTASNIVGPSEEVVLENEASNNNSEGDESEGDRFEDDESEGDKSEEVDKPDVAKLDDTINICKKAGFGYVLILLNLREFN